MLLKSSEINRVRDYSSLFSRQHVNSWLNNDFESLNARILNYDKKILSRKNITYKQYLKEIYKTIEHSYQNEYVIKNSFLNEWLRNELGQTSSRIYSEFRVGNSVVDLAMFNGISRAFEIKSELDSPTRLQSQLKDYLKLFNETYIVVPKHKLDIYSHYNESVGIISFTKESKEKFELVRNAKPQTIEGHLIVMNVLRSKEYKSIVKRYFGYLPTMTSFNQYETCKNLISQIPLEQLNELLLLELKSRTQQSHLSSNYHKEFNQLSLALKLSKVKFRNLIDNLNQPININ